MLKKKVLLVILVVFFLLLITTSSITISDDNADDKDHDDKIPFILNKFLDDFCHDPIMKKHFIDRYWELNK